MLRSQDKVPYLNGGVPSGIPVSLNQKHHQGIPQSHVAQAQQDPIRLSMQQSGLQHAIAVEKADDK